MRLRRKLDRTLTTMLGIKFLMKNGEVEVACRADRDMLRYRFGSVDPNSDALVFKLNREEIEKVASEKYEAGKTEPHTDATVIVRSEDFQSPLSRKLTGAN